MIIRAYIGAFLGSALGVLVGIFALFMTEAKADFRLTRDDLTLPVFLGIWISGILLSLFVIFLRRREKNGFWYTLAIAASAGVFYPFVLWYLFVMGLVFVFVPMLLLWNFKFYVLIAGLIAFLGWLMVRGASTRSVQVE